MTPERIQELREIMVLYEGSTTSEAAEMLEAAEKLNHLQKEVAAVAAKLRSEWGNEWHQPASKLHELMQRLEDAIK